MNQDDIKDMEPTFEAIKRIDENGEESWDGGGLIW